MKTVKSVGGPVLATSTLHRKALAFANGLDRLITHLCRFIVLVTGIALTVILTGNVVARYVFASGGIDAAQELPERLFPWFIVAGVALAAQAGGHMSVDWLLEKFGHARPPNPASCRQRDRLRLVRGPVPAGDAGRRHRPAGAQSRARPAE